jgi:LCP family protein required for cell wall assembly
VSDETPGGSTLPVDEPAVAASPGRPPRGLRRFLVALGVLLAVLVAVVGGGLWYFTDRYAGNIDRIGGVFDDLDEESRQAPATPAETAGAAPITFLLVGTDSRGSADEGIAEGGRSDAIVIARFSGDRQHARLVSIPRDSWVDIPGHGTDKINAAYAYGGPWLLVQTVEQVTGVRIDHYAAIDFEGITQVTDEVGGAEVIVAETTSNGPYTFEAGVDRLDGDEARWYLGQRHGLDGGDFERMRRQQQFLEAVFSQLFASGTFSDPRRRDAAQLAVTDAVAVDDSLGDAELVGLAYSLRGLRPEAVDSFTAPVLGTGTERAASVVYLDEVTGERLWACLRTDSLSQNAEEFGDEALLDVPR